MDINNKNIVIKSNTKFTMSMYSNEGVGYCIICRKVTQQDINNAICYNCLPQDYNPYNTSVTVEGKFCHICGVGGRYSHRYPCCKYCEGLDRNGADKESNVYIEWLNKYKNKDVLNSLKPLWACCENSSQAMNSINNQAIDVVDISKIISVTNLDRDFNLEDIFENSYKSNSRILNILERWHRNLYVDPPQIIQRKNKTYYFKNGQHRTMAAYYLKASTIPIFILKEK